MEKTLDLSICIVSWKIKDLLKNCLKSVYAHTLQISFEVFVLDNNSRDGSVEMVAAEFPQVKLIKNDKNDGFTKTNNQMIRQSQGRYIILLNPDTVVQAQALAKMVAFMDSHPAAGAAGPRLLNGDGSLQPSCLGFPTLSALVLRNIFIEYLLPWNPISKKYLLSDFKHDKTKEVDQPMGAALLVRREVIDQVGLLDENIVHFFDEVDWCYRIKSAGWKIYFLAEAQITHFGGQSIKKWNFIKLSHLWNKSRDYYFGKHHGSGAVIILRLSDFFRALIILTIFFIPGYFLLAKILGLR